MTSLMFLTTCAMSSNSSLRYTASIFTFSPQTEQHFEYPFLQFRQKLWPHGMTVIGWEREWWQKLHWRGGIRFEYRVFSCSDLPRIAYNWALDFFAPVKSFFKF